MSKNTEDDDPDNDELKMGELSETERGAGGFGSTGLN